MKAKIFIAVAALALAGCQTKSVQELSYTEKNQLAKEIAMRCAKQGYADGHPQQRSCIAHEVRREVATRENNKVRQDRARMALASGMGAMSQGYYNAAAASAASRPINCTSTPRSTWVNGPISSVSTSCY